MASEVVVDNQEMYLPVLIIDSEGTLGLSLYAYIKKFVPVVLVGGKEPDSKENVEFLFAKESISHIPSRPYSHIFFLPHSEKEYSDFFQNLVQQVLLYKSRLLVILPKNIATQSMLQEISSNSQAIVLGDLFGATLPMPKETLWQMFVLAKSKKTLQLDGMGQRKMYPVLFADAIAEILRIAFGQESRNTLLVFPHFGMSQLSVAHSLQKVDPAISIDFSSQEENETQERVTGAYVLPQEYDVSTKLQEAYKVFQYKKTPEDGERIVEIRDKIRQPADETRNDSEDANKEKEFWQGASIPVKKKMSWWKAMVLFIFVLLFLPLLTTLLSGGVGAFSLMQAKTQIEKGGISLAQKNIDSANTSFGLGLHSGEILQQEAGIIGLQKQAQLLMQRMRVGQVVAQECSYIIDIAKEWMQPVPQVASLQYMLLQSLSNVNQIDTSLLPQRYRVDLATYKKGLTLLTNLGDSLPALLGFGEKKTYLILFQNNAELRPGGGFIGSYGLVTLKNGRAGRIEIADVYDADGQLKGHVEPAFPVRRYLGNVHQYLRDSNFSLDFATNASTAASMLFMETEKKVDGVIAIDLSFIKEVLQGVGGVYLSDYGIQVTGDNFFSIAEEKSEKNTFAGSSQKKDFLRSAFVALQDKLLSGGSSNLSLAKQLLTAIDEKHVLVASANSSVEDSLIVNNLGGSLWDGRVAAKNTLTDTLGINEANLGVNKVNYYLDRSVSHKVMITDTGVAQETVGITYTNKSADGQWPAGEYKNYLRMLVPKNTQLGSITIDGVQQKIVPAVTDFLQYEKKDFHAPDGLEVDTKEEQGYETFGFLISVPTHATKTIVVSYTLATAIDLSLPVWFYSGKYIKQPGTDSYPLHTDITFPSTFTVLSAKNLSKQGVFDGNVSTDMEFTLQLGKK